MNRCPHKQKCIKRQQEEKHKCGCKCNSPEIPVKHICTCKYFPPRPSSRGKCSGTTRCPYLSNSPVRQSSSKKCGGSIKCPYLSKSPVRQSPTKKDKIVSTHDPEKPELILKFPPPGALASLCQNETKFKLDVGINVTSPNKQPQKYSETQTLAADGHFKKRPEDVNEANYKVLSEPKEKPSDGTLIVDKPRKDGNETDQKSKLPSSEAKATLRAADTEDKSRTDSKESSKTETEKEKGLPVDGSDQFELQPPTETKHPKGEKPRIELKDKYASKSTSETTSRPSNREIDTVTKRSDKSVTEDLEDVQIDSHTNGETITGPNTAEGLNDNETPVENKSATEDLEDAQIDSHSRGKTISGPTTDEGLNDNETPVKDKSVTEDLEDVQIDSHSTGETISGPTTAEGLNDNETPVEDKSITEDLEDVQIDSQTTGETISGPTTAEGLNDSKTPVKDKSVTEDLEDAQIDSHSTGETISGPTTVEGLNDNETPVADKSVTENLEDVQVDSHSTGEAISGPTTAEGLNDQTKVLGPKKGNLIYLAPPQSKKSLLEEQMGDLIVKKSGLPSVSNTMLPKGSSENRMAIPELKSDTSHVRKSSGNLPDIEEIKKTPKDNEMSSIVEEHIESTVESVLQSAPNQSALRTESVEMHEPKYNSETKNNKYNETYKPIQETKSIDGNIIGAESFDSCLICTVTKHEGEGMQIEAYVEQKNSFGSNISGYGIVELTNSDIKHDIHAVDTFQRRDPENGIPMTKSADSKINTIPSTDPYIKNLTPISDEIFVKKKIDTLEAAPVKKIQPSTSSKSKVTPKESKKYSSDHVHTSSEDLLERNKSTNNNPEKSGTFSDLSSIRSGEIMNSVPKIEIDTSKVDQPKAILDIVTKSVSDVDEPAEEAGVISDSFSSINSVNSNQLIKAPSESIEVETMILMKKVGQLQAVPTMIRNRTKPIVVDTKYMEVQTEASKAKSDQFGSKYSSPTELEIKMQHIPNQLMSLSIDIKNSKNSELRLYIDEGSATLHTTPKHTSTASMANGVYNTGSRKIDHREDFAPVIMQQPVTSSSPHERDADLDILPLNSKYSLSNEQKTSDGHKGVSHSTKVCESNIVPEITMEIMKRDKLDSMPVVPSPHEKDEDLDILPLNSKYSLSNEQKTSDGHKGVSHSIKVRESNIVPEITMEIMKRNKLDSMPVVPSPHEKDEDLDILPLNSKYSLSNEQKTSDGHKGVSHSIKVDESNIVPEITMEITKRDKLGYMPVVPDQSDNMGRTTRDEDSEHRMEIIQENLKMSKVTQLLSAPPSVKKILTTPASVAQYEESQLAPTTSIRTSSTEVKTSSEYERHITQSDSSIISEDSNICSDTCNESSTNSESKTDTSNDISIRKQYKKDLSKTEISTQSDLCSDSCNESSSESEDRIIRENRAIKKFDNWKHAREPDTTDTSNMSNETKMCSDSCNESSEMTICNDSCNESSKMTICNDSCNESSEITICSDSCNESSSEYKGEIIKINIDVPGDKPDKPLTNQIRTTDKKDDVVKKSTKNLESASKRKHIPDELSGVSSNDTNDHVIAKKVISEGTQNSTEQSKNSLFSILKFINNIRKHKKKRKRIR